MNDLEHCNFYLLVFYSPSVFCLLPLFIMLVVKYFFVTQVAEIDPDSLDGVKRYEELDNDVPHSNSKDEDAESSPNNDFRHTEVEFIDEGNSISDAAA